jgi:hypothetical protein
MKLYKLIRVEPSLYEPSLNFLFKLYSFNKRTDPEPSPSIFTSSSTCLQPYIHLITAKTWTLEEAENLINLQEANS